MNKTVLDVGQCGYDGPRLEKMLETKVGVAVDSADSVDETLRKLAANQYDLILVNRELAFEEADGLDLIRQVKESGNATPIMLVSDRADAQAEAEAAGAIRGFGKSKLTDRATIDHLKRAIGLA